METTQLNVINKKGHRVLRLFGGEKIRLTTHEANSLEQVLLNLKSHLFVKIQGRIINTNEIRYISAIDEDEPWWLRKRQLTD